jgi:hypothetical protein
MNLFEEGRRMLFVEFILQLLWVAHLNNEKKNLVHGLEGAPHPNVVVKDQVVQSNVEASVHFERHQLSVALFCSGRQAPRWLFQDKFGYLLQYLLFDEVEVVSCLHQYGIVYVLEHDLLLRFIDVAAENP